MRLYLFLNCSKGLDGIDLGEGGRLGFHHASGTFAIDSADDHAALEGDDRGEGGCE